MIMRALDDCDFMRNMFDISVACCGTCHEMDDNLSRVKVIDEIILYVCCVMKHFINDLNDKDRQIIVDNYDKGVHFS